MVHVCSRAVLTPAVAWVLLLCVVLWSTHVLFALSRAGYQQQDAHEFYLSALSALASASIASLPQPQQLHSAAAQGRSAPFGSAATEGTDLMTARCVPQAATTAVRAGTLTTWSLMGSCCARRYACMCVCPRTIRSACCSRGATCSAVPAHGASHPAPGPAGLAQGGCSPLHAVAGGAGPQGGHGSPPPGCTAMPLGGGGAAGQAAPVPATSLVDAVFGGVLRSDVTCCACGHTSTAYDPFLDISLDMVSMWTCTTSRLCV